MGGILIWSRPPKNFRPLRGRISSFLEVSEQIKILFFSTFFSYKHGLFLFKIQICPVQGGISQGNPLMRSILKWNSPDIDECGKGPPQAGKFLQFYILEYIRKQ